MMEDQIRYPIGIQTFRNLLWPKNAYVDKTAYIDKLISLGSRTFSLSRPSGFGKSLFLSTLEAYFRGYKVLFEGLAVYEKTLRWDSFPILRFDFGRAEVDTSDKLESFIDCCLSDLGRKYDITDITDTNIVSYRFGALIEHISRSQKLPVVILIDDYDHSLDPALVNEEQRKKNWQVLRHFLSQIKSLGEFIHFCFITGTTPLEDDCIFSSCIDPYDISNDREFAGICGFTKDELADNFNIGIQALAKEYNLSFEQALERLSYKYGGYYFVDNGEMVHNPTSVLKCLSSKKFENFWINSHRDNAIGEYLQKTDYRLFTLDDLWVWSGRMRGFSSKEIIPNLYQSGLLTILESSLDFYHLGIPNGEVYSAIANNLMPKYLDYSPEELDNVMENLLISLSIEDFEDDGVMRIFRELLSHINVNLKDQTNFVNSFHQTVYTLYVLLSQYTPCQINLLANKVFLVVSISDIDYIFCFIMMGSAHKALELIDKPKEFLTGGEKERKVIKVGIVLTSDTFNIGDYDAEWVE